MGAILSSWKSSRSQFGPKAAQSSKIIKKVGSRPLPQGQFWEPKLKKSTTWTQVVQLFGVFFQRLVFSLTLCDFRSPLQVEKTGKTIGVSSKIKVFDILENIGFGNGFGPSFGIILALSWRQVGSKGGF